MKILYENFKDKERKCSNCVKFTNCKASMFAFLFDSDCCKEYKYTTPFKMFETENKDFIDKIIKLIEEYKNEQNSESF